VVLEVIDEVRLADKIHAELPSSRSSGDTTRGSARASAPQPRVELFLSLTGAQ
jgi:ABC-type ATPase involved in cell division